MKTTNKIIILFIIILVFGLAVVILLHKTKPNTLADNDIFLLPNQEKTEQKTEIESRKLTERETELPSKSQKDSHSSENTIVNDAEFEEFFVDEVGNELREKFGSHVFEEKPVEIVNHPNSVIIEFKPELKSVQKYELYSKSCDEDGNILQDTTAVSAETGEWKYEVVAVSEDGNSFTVKESVGGTSTTVGSKFKLSMEKISPVFEKLFTYAKDGTLLKAEYKGRDVTSAFQRLPCLTFPKKELSVGDSWVCGGKPEDNWKIEASVSGFAQISGHDCVVVSFNENHQPNSTEPGVRRVSSVTRKGKQYYDLEKMILVRNEYIETMESDFGVISSLGVKNLIEK